MPPVAGLASRRQRITPRRRLSVQAFFFQGADLRMTRCAIHRFGLDSIMREVGLLIDGMAGDAVQGTMDRSLKGIRVNATRHLLAVHLPGELRVAVTVEAIRVRLPQCGVRPRA